MIIIAFCPEIEIRVFDSFDGPGRQREAQTILSNHIGTLMRIFALKKTLLSLSFLFFLSCSNASVCPADVRQKRKKGTGAAKGNKKEERVTVHGDGVNRIAWMERRRWEGKKKGRHTRSQTASSYEPIHNKINKYFKKCREKKKKTSLVS